MKRRTVLGLVGGVAGGLAGCLSTLEQASAPSSTASTPSSTASTPPETPTGTPPANTGGLAEFDPAETYKRVEVGSRDGVSEDFLPHDLRIWNGMTERRVVHLRLLDRVETQAVHRATYRIPADDALEVVLLEPSRYVIQLWGPAFTAETLLVPCSFFDCNSSVTSIGVFENGDVRSSVSSTLAACPAPEC